MTIAAIMPITDTFISTETISTARARTVKAIRPIRFKSVPSDDEKAFSAHFREKMPEPGRRPGHIFVPHKYRDKHFHPRDFASEPAACIAAVSVNGPPVHIVGQAVGLQAQLPRSWSKIERLLTTDFRIGCNSGLRRSDRSCSSLPLLYNV